MNAVEGTITFTLAEWADRRERETAMEGKLIELEKALATADAINGAAVNRQVELEAAVESLTAQLAKVRKAMESAAGVVDELRDALTDSKHD